MTTLTKVGVILSLISGIIAVGGGIVELLGSAITILSFGTVPVEGDAISGIVSIVLGGILIFLYLGRISIGDQLLLGILIIVLGVFGGGSLATVGGILILVDYLVNSSSSYQNTTRSRSST